MKRLARALIVAAAVGAGSLGASAMPAGSFANAPARQDGRNAALYYWRAFYSVDRDFQREVGEAIPPSRTVDWRPPAALAQKTNENQSYINELLVATRIDKCDFGIAYEEGFMALLPHLGLMRAGTRILVVDARRLMDKGDWDGAAERVAAMYRMAVHLKNDSVLISSLVAAAIGANGNTEVEALVASGHLTPASRDAILGALQPLNQADGYGVKRCIETERTMALDYLRRTMKGPEAGKKLLEMGILEADAELKEKIKVMDEAALMAELDKVEPYYAGLLAAWDANDYQAKFKELEQKIERGDFGLIAQLIVPAMSKSKSASVKAAEELSKTVHALQTAKLAEAPKNPPSGN